MHDSLVMRRGSRGWMHWCPACETEHPLPDSWAFDGNLDRPTFSPSFAQTFMHWTGGIDPSGLGLGERQQRLCHYFVKDGNLQFLPDSWHKRSDIVAMPPLPAPKDGFAHETQD